MSSDIPTLPGGAAGGFTPSFVIAAVLETGTAGNRIVIADVPPNGGIIAFYTGIAADEQPSKIGNFITGAGEPALRITAGDAGPGVTDIPVVELVGDDGTHTNERSLDLIADDVVIFKTNPGSDTIITSGHAAALTHQGSPLAGAARGLGPFLTDFGTINPATTDVTGKFPITFAQTAFAGIGALQLSILNDGALGWSLDSITTTGCVIQVVFANTGLPIGIDTLSVSYQATGW